MLRLTGTLVLLLVFCCGLAQKTPLTEAEKAKLDSMLKDDEFVNMLKEALSPKSYFVVSAGIGNSYFSTKNKKLDASQLQNKAVFTPSVAYNHKSGLALTSTAFMTDFKNKFGLYQFSLTPSYSLTKSKKVGTTISFTHIFARSGYESYASPFKNDFYADVYLKKPWLEPGIAIGLSGGRYTDYIKVDTVLNGIRRIFTDTVKTRLTAFSLNAFVQHEFEYFELFSKKDGISIVPQLMLNAGSQRFTEVHQNPFISRLKARNNVRFKNLGVNSGTNSFAIQSLAFNLDINYSVGKFGFEPQLYLDYYLPETTDKKFTSVYSLVVSYSF